MLRPAITPPSIQLEDEQNAPSNKAQCFCLIGLLLGFAGTVYFWDTWRNSMGEERSRQEGGGIFMALLLFTSAVYWAKQIYDNRDYLKHRFFHLPCFKKRDGSEGIEAGLIIEPKAAADPREPQAVAAVVPSVSVP